MGVILYSFNVNLSPKTSHGVLEVMLLCYRMTCLGFCDKKGALFVPDPALLVPSLWRFFTEAGAPGTWAGPGAPESLPCTAVGAAQLSRSLSAP